MDKVKVVVLDTNVLVDDPKAMYRFPDALVVIPQIVIDELDNLKTSKDPTPRRGSRKASWQIDEITELNEGKVEIILDNGGKFKIDHDCEVLFETEDRAKPDNKILSVALRYAREGHKTTLFSNDVNMRNLARSVAHKEFVKDVDIAPKDMLLRTAQHSVIDKSLHEIDSGIRDIEVASALVEKCRKDKSIDMELPFLNGEHIMLRDEWNPEGHVILAQYDAINKKVRAINDYKKGEPIWRIGKGKEGATDVRPRDARQTFLANDILDTSKNLHFVLSRVAGAGKNFITTACALNLLEMGEYDRLIIVKPMVSTSDIGYLPGTKEEKMAPWFESHNDTMSELTNENQSLTQDLEARIELDIVTHMRGRSIPRVIMIIDEAQNFSEEDLKTLGSRIGQDAKIIIMGDLSQIDNPRLDSSNCGLRVWAERARNLEHGYGKSTYILLESNFRSEVSAWFSSFYE